MMKNDIRRNLGRIFDLNESSGSTTTIDDEVISDDDQQVQNVNSNSFEAEVRLGGTANDTITEANFPDINNERFTDDESESFADEDWEEDEVEEVPDISMGDINSGQQINDHYSTANQREDDLAEEQPLYDGAPITMGTSIFLLMSFAITHSLSGEALSDLLELISVHCKKPNLSTQSVYKFKSLFRRLKTPLRCHYYCIFCHGLLEGPDAVLCRY
jgi:hypothetical protein